MKGNLDSLDVEGYYHINNSTVASTANGFPIAGSGGFLRVRKNTSNVFHQYWETYSGSAFRWVMFKRRQEILFGNHGEDGRHHQTVLSILIL